MESCYGCGVCSKACPQKIIGVRLNKNGFYKPYIDDKQKCTSCGLCLDVCAYADLDVEKDESFDVLSYAAWSRNSDVRRTCSSGGVGYEIAKFLIAEGYEICCAKYNVEKGRVEHYIAHSEEELEESKGSKYIQSFTVEGFKKLDRNRKYLITGTPCQIDSVRRYIRRFRIEKNFILMDFFCHGVPSYLMWRKYIKEVENQVGNVDKVIWRNKKYGWHNSWVMMAEKEGNLKYESPLNKGDLFYQMFLLNHCLGKACYDKCKYKMLSSAADIRIGDLWGTQYENDEKGVSAVLAITAKGNDLLKKIDNLYLKEEPVQVVTEGQMAKSPKKNILYYMDKFLLRFPFKLKTIDRINHLVLRAHRLLKFIPTLLKR